MDVTTLSYDGSEKEMVSIINAQADKGYRLVNVQNVQSGNFISFVPKESLTPNEQVAQISDQLSIIQQAIDALAMGGEL